MSDVDAIRRMASEHDLEFVDLDAYGVDPAAREILPASLAREHHVVAIKRKFGTPVIATSDPDDLTAQDTVRASIGRDFISVVAASDQIGAYLDQLFGPEGGDTEPGNDASENNSAGEADVEAGTEPQDGSLLVEAEGRLGGDPFGELLADELEENLAVLEAAQSVVAVVEPNPTQSEIVVDDLSDQSTVGPTKRKSGRRKAPDRNVDGPGRSALEISPVPFEEGDWQEFPKESEISGDTFEPPAMDVEAVSAEGDSGGEPRRVDRCHFWGRRGQLRGSGATTPASVGADVGLHARQRDSGPRAGHQCLAHVRIGSGGSGAAPGCRQQLSRRWRRPGATGPHG